MDDETIFRTYSFFLKPWVNVGYLTRLSDGGWFGNVRKNSKKHIFLHLYAAKANSTLALDVIGKYS
ncbi:hypothetical protein FCP67_19620 [Salmonella enterica]|nr:hypothetical protein [Salmonella enterica]